MERRIKNKIAKAGKDFIVINEKQFYIITIIGAVIGIFGAYYFESDRIIGLVFVTVGATIIELILFLRIRLMVRNKFKK